MNEELNKLFEIKDSNSKDTDTNLFNVIRHLATRIIISIIILTILYLISEFTNIGLQGIVNLIFLSTFILLIANMIIFIEASDFNKNQKKHLRNANYFLLILFFPILIFATFMCFQLLKL